MSEPVSLRYAAFISYSHRDSKHAEWLHRALETFRVPGDVKMPSALPHRDRRLSPVFRDREELSSSHDLSVSIRDALTASHALIVICSPAAAASRWVNEEIKEFKKLHGEERIFALIVEGDDNGPEPFFPPALLQKLGPDGEILDQSGEPLAADIRDGKDGKRHAKLKVAAGILDVGLDQLAQREAARERTRMMRVTVASIAGMMAAAALAAFAIVQRDEAKAQRFIAEQEAETVKASADYLVSLFEIANPATENPKTITALTILERGLKKIDTELADKPIVQAKLKNTIGSVYHQLGDVRRAKPILEAAAKGPFSSLEDEFLAKIDYLNALTRLREHSDAALVMTELETMLNDGSFSKDDSAFLKSQFYQQKALSNILQSNSQEAVKWYREAKSACDTTDSTQREACAGISSSLGAVLVQRKNFEEGLVELENARKILAEMFGEKHLKTAALDHNMGYADFEAGKYETAIEKMSVAVSVYNELLEENHPLKGDAELVLGRIYDKSERPEKAVPHLKRSKDIYAAAFGNTNVKVGYGLVFLALSEARAGATKASFETLEIAEEIYKLHFEPGSYDMIDLQIYTAWIQSLAGQHKTALAGCTDGLSALAKMEKEGPYIDWLKSECALVRERYTSNVQ